MNCDHQSGPHDAAKARVAGRSIDRLRVAGGGAIAPAVVGRTEERAALEHLSGDSDLGHLRVVAPLPIAAPGVDTNGAGAAAALYLVVVQVPIGGPFPYIAGHVV